MSDTDRFTSTYPILLEVGDQVIKPVWLSIFIPDGLLSNLYVKLSPSASVAFTSYLYSLSISAIEIGIVVILG